MNLNFTWINLLILFGAVQALVFSIVLLFQRRHPGAGFLAMFVFVFAYNGFETFNWSAGLDQHYLFFDLFAFIVIYALGPSLYLYINKLLFPELQYTQRQVLAHYAPVLFQFITRMAIVTYHLLLVNNIIISDIHSTHLIDIVWMYAERLSVFVFMVYYGATILKFRKYVKANAAKLHVKERQTVFGWVRALLIAMGAFAVAWPITVLVPDLFNVPFGLHYYPIEIGLVLFSYWIIFYGYYKVRTISIRSAGISNQLGGEVVQDYARRLQKAMEDEKLYLDAELSINIFAAHTGIPGKTISAILNQHYRVNFNDFVNRYRTKEVQDRLADPGYRHLTISGIALEAGFNSQATFQRVFKNNTGMSPKEYINLQLRNTA